MVRGPPRKMYRIKNIPAGLKWTSRLGLRFLFYFLKHMKDILVEFIIVIVYLLFSIFLKFHILNKFCVILNQVAVT